MRAPLWLILGACGLISSPLEQCHHVPVCGTLHVLLL
uniref:Uncharacterized protein n=1 Tax=Anguilla anguilla TaxID=7936 RepID=A0A0E9S4B0_ANGAN